MNKLLKDVGQTYLTCLVQMEKAGARGDVYGVLLGIFCAIGITLDLIWGFVTVKSAVSQLWGGTFNIHIGMLITIGVMIGASIFCAIKCDRDYKYY